MEATTCHELAATLKAKHIRAQVGEDSADFADAKLGIGDLIGGFKPCL